MKLKLIKTITIPAIPSASGIAKYETHYFVVGDDSPYMFEIDANFQIVRKIQLFSEDELIGKRIPKAKKPDFEALEIIDNKELIIFGSGSKSPERNVLVRYDLKTEEIIKSSLAKFYNNLKALPIMKQSELNIEATCYKNDFLYLFNRSNNVVFVFNYCEFIDHVENQEAFPKLVSHQFLLPSIAGIESKFSGATTLEKSNTILFTSSVEDTANAYDDGEILGSFVGTIAFENNAFDSKIKFAKVSNEHKTFKVESVVVIDETSPNKIKIILVTDNDRGDSEVLDCELEY